MIRTSVREIMNEAARVLVTPRPLLTKPTPEESRPDVATQKRIPETSVVDRLVANSVRSGNGCLTWTGSISPTGYGQMSWRGSSQGAHRWAYEVWVGPIPLNAEVDHLCRNRACIDPRHLEAVDRYTNIMRSSNWSAFNAAATHCPRGHELAPYRRGGKRRCLPCERRKITCEACGRGISARHIAEHRRNMHGLQRKETR